MKIPRFDRVYGRALRAAAYLFTVGWARRRNRGIFLDLANSVAMAEIEPRIPVVEVSELVPPGSTYTMREIVRARANVAADELAIISALARIRRGAGSSPRKRQRPPPPSAPTTVG